MMGVISKRACGALFTTTAILCPLSAYAQQDSAITLQTLQVQSDDPTESTQDEIVRKDTTSATKTDTPVVETPQSVTTITRKQMDDQNTQSVKDALSYSAGVLSTIDATDRYDSVFIRGFGGFGTSTRVVDFYDGLKLPRGQAFALPSVDAYVLDHVDVLKGPSAVLYGQTSPGGLVNEESRQPSADSAHEVMLQAGTDNRMQAGFSSRGALDQDGHWQYSFSGIGRTADTRYDDVKEQRIAVSPAIKWQPDADTQLTLRGYYQNDPDGGYFNSTYMKSLAPSAFRSYLDRDLNVGDPSFDDYDRTQYGIGYSFDHRFNDLVSVSSKTRYWDIDLDMQSLQIAGGPDSNGDIARAAVRSIEDVAGVSTDNHATFEFATGAVDHTALVGVDYQHSVSNWEYQYGAASSLNVVNPVYGTTVGALTTMMNNRQTLQQAGTYVQDQMTIGGFHVVLGTRYDWTDQETENKLTDTTSHQSGQSPTYRAGVLYKFDNGVAPYLSYSTSFEPTVGVARDGTTFRPTKGKQWEAGVKYEPTFTDALFTASLFRIRQQNVLSTDPVDTNYQIQQGEVRSQGVEFEARGHATKNLELIGALTFLNTEITKSSTASNVGKRPQAVPDFYGSTWANYSFDSGFLNGFTLGGGLRFAGSSYADDANTYETEGYILVDTAVSYKLDQLSPDLAGATATLSATNLLDNDYYTSCSSGFYCQYGNGAQVLAGLRYRW